MSPHPRQVADAAERAVSLVGSAILCLLCACAGGRPPVDFLSLTGPVPSGRGVVLICAPGGASGDSVALALGPDFLGRLDKDEYLHVDVPPGKHILAAQGISGPKASGLGVVGIVVGSIARVAKHNTLAAPAELSVDVSEGQITCVSARALSGRTYLQKIPPKRWPAAMREMTSPPAGCEPDADVKNRPVPSGTSRVYVFKTTSPRSWDVLLDGVELGTLTDGDVDHFISVDCAPGSHVVQSKALGAKHKFQVEPGRVHYISMWKESEGFSSSGISSLQEATGRVLLANRRQLVPQEP